MSQKILIGPMNEKDVGSIPTLNRAFAKGLSNKYEFIPIILERNYGKSSLAKFNFLNIYYFFKQYFKIIFLTIKHRPDIFHYAVTSFWNFEKSMIFLNTAKLFGAKKVVGHLHGGSFDKFMTNLTGFRKSIGLKLFSNLDAVLVASEYWKGFLEKQNISTHVQVVNNPIDIQYIEAVKKHEISNKKRNDRFLFVGALGKRKGFYDIVETFGSITKSIFLDAIGNEDKKNDLAKIKELLGSDYLKAKINLIISDKLSVPDKANYFCGNGVFLFPSHNENFPLVIIEAACAGMPIITTSVGAIPEFFDHMENIYFVEPGNQADIKKAVEYMMDNPAERKRLGEGAKKVYLTKLSQDIIMSQLGKTYESLLKV